MVSVHEVLMAGERGFYSNSLFPRPWLCPLHFPRVWFLLPDAVKELVPSCCPLGRAVSCAVPSLPLPSPPLVSHPAFLLKAPKPVSSHGFRTWLPGPVSPGVLMDVLVLWPAFCSLHHRGRTKVCSRKQEGRREFRGD